MAEADFRSRTKLGGVPVHAMLVPFPITCFSGALLADLAYYNSGGEVQWANFAQWLLVFGEIFGVTAALFGLIDLLRTPARARPTAVWFHFAGSATTLTLGLFNNFIHSRDGWTGVVPTGLTLSVLTVIALVFTGFLGHRLAYVHQRGSSL